MQRPNAEISYLSAGSLGNAAVAGPFLNERFVGSGLAGLRGGRLTPDDGVVTDGHLLEFVGILYSRSIRLVRLQNIKIETSLKHI